jgi:hypothetical protein
MNDQIRTVGAGQDVFTKGQCGPAEVVLEQIVAGSFFDFSLTHPARSEGAVVQQRERPRRSVTANNQPRVAVKAEVCEADAERSVAAFTAASGGPEQVTAPRQRGIEEEYGWESSLGEVNMFWRA